MKKFLVLVFFAFAVTMTGCVPQSVNAMAKAPSQKVAVRIYSESGNFRGAGFNKVMTDSAMFYMGVHASYEEDNITKEVYTSSSFLFFVQRDGDNLRVEERNKEGTVLSSTILKKNEAILKKVEFSLGENFSADIPVLTFRGILAKKDASGSTIMIDFFDTTVDLRK